MSEVTCPACGGASWRALERFAASAWLAFPGGAVQCRGCGLARLATFPTREELTAYYSGESYLAGYARAGLRMVTEEAETRQALQDRLAYLESLVGRAGRLLDVGASKGTFLAEARGRGWEIEGVELGDEGVRVARERFGISLHHGSFETAPFARESFDVVHASHVLEHLPDPQEFLRHARGLLKPGGVVAIEVPSELGDLFSWFRQTVLRRPPDPFPVPSPHLFFYTPRSLGRLLARSGFEVRRLETPRRNRSATSRLPLGTVVKPIIYRTERALRWGPLIEAYGVRAK